MDAPTIFEKLRQHPARMETLVAELIETGQLNADALVLRPCSLFKRAYSNDIVGYEEQQRKNSKKKQADTLIIDISREGFYDMLPEFLFHAPESIAGYKRLDQRVHESEKAKEEEAAARQFFLPFEQEFFRMRIQMEEEERLLLSGFSNPMQRAIFNRFWTDVQGLDPATESILFYLLPLAHKIAGNRPLMAACFQEVLREQVRLEDVLPDSPQPDSSAAPGLGSAGLGFDFVVGAMSADELPDLRVTIGPLDRDALPDYLEGGKKTRLLEILYSYFVPAEMDVQTNFELKKREALFVLDEDEATGRLAYSTYI